MKNDPLISALIAGLAASALASVVLFLFYYTPADRELRNLQGQYSMMQQRQVFINALGADVMEYSKKNPAIDPILESFGVKQPKAGSAKPQTR